MVTEQTKTQNDPSRYGAENVLSIEDSKYWLAENGKTDGQGFTIKVGNCSMMLSGVFIKNIHRTHATKSFRVLGSMSGEVGSFSNLTEASLENPLLPGAPPPIVQLISFPTQVEVWFLRFELLDFWSSNESKGGGGLAYFSAYPMAGKKSAL